MPERFDELDSLAAGDAAGTSPKFPFVLSAGERRGFTANAIIRDPDWRRKDRAGALRIHPDGARAVTGVAPNEPTSGADRDWLAGTPWHKHVPARIERA